ncbi:hypothetical protein PRZ48_012592 [Zasmidium cellare]|uniref:Uncharacterized protein n=1 Tax=Zasmidium cellare TaxID=395010 RepID=A0ABR0E5C2_ZASCE|nr:hypothetical protein PRZ48_012592 [Zasmidium cellare]
MAPTKPNLAPQPNDPPASTRLPTELRLEIWDHYFTTTALPYHTLTAPTNHFTHQPALLNTTPQLRAEALPFYLARLRREFDNEEERYGNYMQARPSDNCAEDTYRRWVGLMTGMEGHLQALRWEMAWVAMEVDEGKEIVDGL